LRFHVTALDDTDSTQSEVKRLAAAGAYEGTVVTARHQRAGRGRRGRDWWDAPGQSLLVSVLLRPSSPPTVAAQLSLVGGLAVAAALAEAAAVTARIRWPNDLLVEGRKLCGILAEASTDASGRLVHVILGVGLNLDQTTFPEALRERATSLRLVTGVRPDADRVLAAVLDALARYYAEWRAGGFTALRATWLGHSMVPGQVIRFPDGSRGEAVDIGEDGLLLARGGDGRVIRVLSGDPVEEGTTHATRH
jgi:BirA family biotin operon repressor/biotin-[acetyl-CoA-carboxylase] ligase